MLPKNLVQIDNMHSCFARLLIDEIHIHIDGREIAFASLGWFELFCPTLDVDELAVMQKYSILVGRLHFCV